MKKILFAFLFVLAIKTNAQTSKADSIKQAEINKVVNEIVTKTSIATFQEWLYKTMTAEKFNEFLQYYNGYIQQAYNEKLKSEKK